MSSSASRSFAPGERFLFAFVVVAFVVFLAASLATLDHPYVEPNAWVSAHFALMAEVFDDQGALHQGWVPIQSYAPQGTSPEIYIHWPPLFPVLLGEVFGIFGVSEASARAFMLVILLINAGLIFLLARSLVGRRAAWLATLAWISMPTVLDQGLVVLHLHLAIAWTLLSLWAFRRAVEGDEIERRYAVIGLVAMLIGMLSSWEPSLACPGLLLAALWQKHRPSIRLALAYNVAAFVGGMSVIGAFVAQTPDFFAELRHVARFRSGLAETYSAQGGAELPSLQRLIFRYQDRLDLVGPVALFALAALLLGAFFLRSEAARSRTTAVMSGLAAFWILWFVLMRGHAYFHDYQMLVAAPFAALAVAIVIEWAARALLPAEGGARNAVIMALFVALPLVLLKPLVVTSYLRVSSGVEQSLEIDHAREVREAVPEGSIVLSPYGGMVVSYYIGRRTFRGIRDDQSLSERLPEILAIFPEDVPIYLALRPEDRGGFPETFATHPPIAESDDLVLTVVRGGSH